LNSKVVGLAPGLAPAFAYFATPFAWLYRVPDPEKCSSNKKSAMLIQMNAMKGICQLRKSVRVNWEWHHDSYLPGVNVKILKIMRHFLFKTLVPSLCKKLLLSKINANFFAKNCRKSPKP
jgi:hypothetical protein